MIPMDALDQMFANIREKTSWNVDGQMLWGYFFFDPNESKLQRLAETLTEQGYRIVGIEATDDGDTYRLHAEKIEVHSPATLNARNEELQTLAKQFDVATYDGMDVGPVKQ